LKLRIDLVGGRQLGTGKGGFNKTQLYKALIGLLAFWAAASYGRQRESAALGLCCASGWLIFSALLLWGFIDEVTQPMFGRGFDWNDYLANAMGLFLASTLAALPWLSGEIKSICRRRASPGQ